MVISDTNAVFDSDPNTAKPLWPSLAIRNIDTTATHEYGINSREGGSKGIRFHGDALACLEDIASGVSGAIVNIKSDIMPEMMREQDVHCLGILYQHGAPNRPQSWGTYISSHIEPKLLQLIFQTILCDIM